MVASIRFLFLGLLYQGVEIIFATGRTDNRKNEDLDSHGDFRKRKTITRLVAARIIGGSDAPNGRYPYFATLEDNNSIVCGGTLIAANVVLTAAHCAGSFSHVTIGRFRKSGASQSIQRFSIEAEVSHPKFDVLEKRVSYSTYDFMLLKIDGIAHAVPLTINSNQSLPIVGTELTVMGFGTKSPKYYNPTHTLQQAIVNYIPNGACSTANDPRSDYGSFEGMITEDMMCAAAPGKDACSGDSGGPLIIPGQDPSKDLLVGVVSWGFSCSLPDYPGVYGRVSHVIDWIRQVVCEMTAAVVDEYKRIGCNSDGGEVQNRSHSPYPSPQPSSVSVPISASGSFSVSWYSLAIAFIGLVISMFA